MGILFVFNIGMDACIPRSDLRDNTWSYNSALSAATYKTLASIIKPRRGLGNDRHLLFVKNVISTIMH